MTASSSVVGGAGAAAPALEGAATTAAGPTYADGAVIIPAGITPAIWPGIIVGMGMPFGKGIMMGDAR
jgi:hypothetical protein